VVDREFTYLRLTNYPNPDGLTHLSIALTANGVIIPSETRRICADG